MTLESPRTTMLVVMTFMLGLEGVAITKLVGDPLQAALANSFWWTLLFSLLAASRIAAEMMTLPCVVLAPYPHRI